ncbi:hypothetical protein DFH08DRAFT_817791 [Mycena albidolilacea]|uniref:Uncharacterized protein n=1 Tax=Mycena albidolilacea TaxID=1033008 RepID=A0AAD6ZI20_9AGAR|nr:hypothetical protein DFH08DRAFT_817791 [Mycena albidolilacea]
MALSAITRSPTARVYNLRFLLLANIPLMVQVILELHDLDQYPQPISASHFSAFSCSIVICVHHILAVFKWPMRGLAVIDLGTVVIEIGVLVSLLPGSVVDPRGWMIISLPLLLLPLLISLVFRLITVFGTEERVLTQRLRFLGCCARSHPPYTPLSIILNRSLTRPLVRGESRYIVVSRALVLSCIALGVPAFGIYATIIVPVNTLVSTRTIRNADWPGSPNNATILIRSDFGGQPPAGGFKGQILATLNDPKLRKINCPASQLFDLPPEYGDFFVCPYGWFGIAKISISIVFPSEIDEAYVHLRCNPERCDEGLAPLPLLPGSHLFGMLTWSQRQRAAHSGPAFVYNPEIYALQPDPSNVPRARSALLTLRLPYSVPAKYLQDTADTSYLSGIATFGGFWTFVNGAFALFFGANVVYFMFGRRPLSALGVVHLFQRRALVRRWHEDFPAIHTEGGLPGSENAGIVAFIRERLVDLGEDPRGLSKDPKDTEERAPPPVSLPLEMIHGRESANQGMQEDHHRQIPDYLSERPVESYLQRSGYILDETPLLTTPPKRE